MIKYSTIEIQNIILTNNPNLFEDSILCQKCYLRLKRGQNLIDSSKPKKCQKLDRPKCIINSCKREPKHNSGATKEDTEEFFGPSINNENQELVTDSFPFCQEHYTCMELYNFLNKCSLCKSSLEGNRYCSEPDLLNWYWSELFPGKAVQLARSDKICDECCFAFQKLKNQSANITLDSDFRFTVFIWKSFS